MYTIKSRIGKETHFNITSTRTLRQACRAILEDTIAIPDVDGVRYYELADKKTTSLVLVMGKEFHVFWTVGEQSRLIPDQKEINSAMRAAGGIKAVENPTLLAVS